MSCEHFAKHLKTNLETFQQLHGYFSAPINKKARLRKAISSYCYVCFNPGTDLFCCLQCVFFGCRGSHINEHLKSQNHYLAMELSHGLIFCFNCKDFIYPEECMRISEENRDKESRSLQIFSGAYKCWMPQTIDIEYLLKNPKRRLLSAETRVGLRGLLNLGSTCFMNCIVQVLVHTPLLRDFFLSDRHNCIRGQSQQCLVCEISQLFQEFYTGEKDPISLHRLLHLIWNNAKHLAGYEQQDAHEFFIALLDLLHTHFKSSVPGSDAKSHSHSHSNCDCIIDQIFTGKLQSDVICQKCKNVSTTIEPFWDISLDLESKSKTINDCLERFTRPEHLGNNVKIKCSACSTYQESTKKLSLRTLPVVASLHLKRFNNSTLVNKKRIDKHISFPLELDLSPFLSDKDSMNPNPTNLTEDYRYSLYGVVNYDGAIDSGHYTAFVRHQKGVWVECDDDHIRIVSPENVLKSEGYLLFYHKKILEYK